MERHIIEHRIGSDERERSSILGDVGVTINRSLALGVPFAVFFGTLAFYAARRLAVVLGWA
jgi:hypothetical protein